MAIAIAVGLGTFSLSGCKGTPELKNVSSSAIDLPINSPEMAQLIQAKYQK